MFRLVIFATLLVSCLAAVPRSRGLVTLPSPSIPNFGRIVGGEAISISEAPYQVVFLYSGVYYCGGSLIRADAVLSAAHCMFATTPSVYSFRAGSDFHSTGGTVIGASRAVPHPSYSGLDYDVSLFVLTSSFTLGSTIGVIPLPLHNQVVLDNASALTSGWGATSEGGSISDTLRQVEIFIVNQQVCGANYGVYGIAVTDNEICAGILETGGKDACQGDSGGPLVVDGQLIGVTSWGIGCARAGLPGVWSRVPAVVNWINSELA